ncbi:RF-1 domain-containing protein [Thelonectria olida]|uniref:RF-1 domain-containing protein n=1 Tax=Thelonectria olida TaxID=1576542 RepID=A0A9P9AQZ9_9HYPO|nr:RF-1 domain-containing protein [Thelonectria olida]
MLNPGVLRLCPTPLNVWLVACAVPCDLAEPREVCVSTSELSSSPPAIPTELCPNDAEMLNRGTMIPRNFLRFLPFRPCAWSSARTASLRTFTTSPATLVKALPPRPKPPPESEIEEFYVKGSGPGGQKINKTNSAVQLRHTPTGIVVKSQATRSRDQNRKHARELLAQRVDELRNGDQSRSSIVGQIKQKRAASSSKKSRRKYKKLEEEKASANASTGADSASEGKGQAPEGDQRTVTHNVERPPVITIQRI